MQAPIVISLQSAFGSTIPEIADYYRLIARKGFAFRPGDLELGDLVHNPTLVPAHRD